MNKFRAPLVTLNAPRSWRMAVDRSQLVQTLGEDVELAVSPAVGGPAPCPGSEQQDSWSFQGPMNPAAIRTDSG